MKGYRILLTEYCTQYIDTFKIILKLSKDETKVRKKTSEFIYIFF